MRAGECLVGQGHLPKNEAAVEELAALLHSHSIGALTLNAGVDAESWRTLLRLLARPPEEVRADGEIAHLWTTAGDPCIDIGEIDYAELLRDRQGLAATIDQIIAAAMAGPRLDLDDSRLVRQGRPPARRADRTEPLGARCRRFGGGHGRRPRRSGGFRH